MVKEALRTGDSRNVNPRNTPLAREISLIPGTKIKRYLGTISLGLLLLFASGSAAPAQDTKTYLSPKYGFTFDYPAAYDLKVMAGVYHDFTRGGKTLFTLRVDDRFIEMLYQMLHPGIVMYRAGEDPYKDLASETRKNMELFRRYARHEAKNWCSADGPDGSVYCEKIEREKQFTSREHLSCLELQLIITREDFTTNTKQQREAGPVFAVYLPREGLPLVLMLSPRHGESASPELVREMREVIDSLKVKP